MKFAGFLKRKGVQQILFVVGFLVAWEVIALLHIYPALLFPDLVSIFSSLGESISTGEMITRTAFSLYLIGAGAALGIAAAMILTTLAMLNRTMANLMETMVTIFDPLPGIALLPIALVWFGTGSKSIIFVIFHSVVWPLILNTYTGFRSVSRTQLEVGRNIGLRGVGLVTNVMVPAAFPQIVTGLRVAWSRSWRALVAAEMVFGASGNEGGLGWMIYERRFFLDIPGVFAALVVIIIIGILIENTFFSVIERRTIQRWGMLASRS